MAAVRSDAAGEILQLLTDQEAIDNPAGPTIAYELRFDTATNGPLFADMQAVTSEYLLLGQALTKNGNTVIPNPPLQAFADIQDTLPTILAKMAEGQALTTGELNAAVRICFRDLGRE